jgi:hypothetical protein
VGGDRPPLIRGVQPTPPNDRPGSRRGVVIPGRRYQLPAA